MAKYIAGRVLAMFITLFIIVTATFILIRLMPNNNMFFDPDLPPWIIEMIMERHRLDRPIHEQYWFFISGIFGRLDFGNSLIIRQGVPVFDVIASRIPITMYMNVLSLFISFPFAILFGMWAALRKDKFADHFISFWIIVFISVPSFVIASMMQYFLTFVFPIFPTLYDPRAALFSWASVYSLALPIIAMALGPIAGLGRYIRRELIDTMSSDFLLLARTKGLSRAQATFRHAFRNAMVPLVNMIIPMFTGIMGGSLVIERIFGIPGMGGIMIDAIQAFDHPLTIATIIFFSAISLVTMLIVDVAYGFVDPRIRMGGKKSG